MFACVCLCCVCLCMSWRGDNAGCTINPLNEFFENFDSFIELLYKYFGIIYLVRMQNLPKNWHFFKTYMCVSGGKKCKFFRKFCGRTQWMIPLASWSLKHLHRGHSLSTYAKFSEKLFLRTYLCISGSNKCWFCRKFGVRTKWMIPHHHDHSDWLFFAEENLIPSIVWSFWHCKWSWITWQNN